ncbi:MAG: O-antigen ligase family protein [Cloacibacterium caeni]
MKLFFNYFSLFKQKFMESLKSDKIELWYFILATVGYFVISGVAIPLKIENSRLFSIPFRFFIFFFSLIIIIRNFKFEKLKNISILAFIAFWFFYILKLNYSLQNDFYTDTFLSKVDEVHIRILAIVVFPSLAFMMIDYSKINFEAIFKAYFSILLVMLSLNLLYGLLMPYQNFELKFIFSMYYISYGHLGTLLAIISFYFLFFKINFLSKYFYYYGFFLGILTIIVSTARSPFLALAVVLLYLIMLNKKLKPILIFLGILFGIILLFYLYNMLGFTQITFINRTNNWIFFGDTSVRTPLFKKAIEIFKDHPFLGGRVLFEDGFYPHNIFLELLMATGLIGIILYFLKFFYVIKNLKIFFNPVHVNANIFFMLFIQYFVLVLTSYSLFGVSEFLYFSAIIIGMVNTAMEKNSYLFL